MNFSCTHRLTSLAIRAFITVVLAAVPLSPIVVNAQVTMDVPQTPAPMKDQGKHATASPSPLLELVQEVEGSNPEIAASLHAWKAATNVPKQASALPDTEIIVQQFSVGSPRPFAGFSNVDFAYVGIGASQDLPYPGKRRLRSEVAKREADSAQAQSDGVRRQAIETLKLVYFKLAYLQQTLPILERNDQLLSQIQQVVESRYRVGQANQQDVLKAQLQHTKILQEIAMHHQEEEQLEAQLKQVLNRSQSSLDIVTEPLSPTPLSYSDADLLNRVRDQNPDVRSRAEMVRRQESQVELSRKEFRPDFNLSYTYEHTADQFPDYYMASFGIRLPNRGRQSAALAEAIQNQERAKQALQGEVQRVLSEVEQQYVLVRRSEDQLKIYTEGLIPQSEATFQAGLAAYLTVLLAGIITPTGVCALMCERHSRAESQRHCSEPSDAMPGMAHDHSAMNHPGVEAMSAVLVSQSCQTNCVTAERLNVWRKVVPQVTVVQSGAVVLGTAAKFLAPDSAAAWILDGSPPSPHSAYAASFSVLRI